TCRNASMPPQALGLVPLAVNESQLAEARRTLFRYFIHDALRRGARDYDLALLRMNYLFSIHQPSASVEDDVLSGIMSDVETGWAQSVIDEENASFQTIVEQEMARVSQLVGEPGLIEDTDDYQYRVRPLYYGAGYTNPANFLEKIVKHKMLGKFAIWIHEDLANLLNNVASILDG